MANSTGPADELLDPQRYELIEELADVIHHPHVSSATWACPWLADMTTFRTCIEKSRSEEMFAVLTSIVFRADGCGPMLETWLSRAKERETGINEEKCMERNNATCLLTGLQAHTVATPIAPGTLDSERNEDTLDSESDEDKLEFESNQRTRNFWVSLELFQKEEIELWKAALSDTKHPGINHLCLTDIAQELWVKARFALRPLELSHDERTLTVQFFWLPRRREYRRYCSMTRIPWPFAPGEGDDTDFKLFRWQDENRLQSGDILTFRTADPVRHPLPSIELLRLQWLLNRVVALSGAADASEKDLDPWSYKFMSDEDDDDEDDK